MQTQSDNQILGALTYPVPIIGVVILLTGSLKNNHALRTNAVQSLALAVPLLVVVGVLGFVIPIIGCVSPFLMLAVTLYYAYQASQGGEVSIPLVSDFCRSQGWI